MVRFRTDLPLAADESTRFLPWIVSFLTFIATLALAGVLVLKDASYSISGALESTLTIEIPLVPGQSDQELEARAQRVIDILKQTQGVASARIIDEAVLRDLISPWLGAGTNGQGDDNSDTLASASVGSDSDSDRRLGVSSSMGFDNALGLPFPKLIDVHLEDPDALDLIALNEVLQKEASAQADDHAIWRTRLTGFFDLLQIAALGVALLVFAAAALMIAFATKGSLTAHRPTIELLHLIGAQDRYIARQFQNRVFNLAILGGFPGAIAAVLVAGFATQAASGLIVGFGGEDPASAIEAGTVAVDLSGAASVSILLIIGMILLSAFTPPLMAFVSVAATRWTVLARLRKME